MKQTSINNNNLQSTTPIVGFSIIPSKTLKQQADQFGYHGQRQTNSDRMLIKPTWRRYLILVLYGICSMEKSFQWINLSTITNKVAFYYGVQNFAVNWTSVLFMITFIPLVLPTGLLIEHIGLRKAILIGQSGITLGAIIKCFACDEQSFWLVLLGQVVVSLSEQFIFCVPSKIAAVWFPDEHVTIATGCGIFGNQFGIALAFIIPEALFRAREDKSSIRIGIEQLFYGTAAVALITMVALLFLFEDEPKYAPGAARLRQLELKSIRKHIQKQQLSIANTTTTTSTSTSISPSSSASGGSKAKGFKLGLFMIEIRSVVKIIYKLIRKPNCCLLMIAYGLNVGTGYTIQTLLNQLIVGKHQLTLNSSSISASSHNLETKDLSSTDSAAMIAASEGHDQSILNANNWTPRMVALELNKLVGQIGLVIIFFGMIGALFWGYLCDLTHRYKLITCCLYGAFIFTLIGFDLSLRIQDLRLLYPMAALMGFSMIGYTTSGLDTLVEYTYPIPELISTSLMVIWPQVFGTVITFASSYIVDEYGRDLATGFMAGSLALGLLISLFVREQLKRQEAIAEKHSELAMSARITSA